MALSPRTRGCSVHAPAIHARLRVVPAHAGVLRPIRTPRCLPGSCPRARGGAPHSRRIRTIFLALSPRTRGCSFVVVSVHKVCAVVPAHAGVLQRGCPCRWCRPVVPAHAGVLRPSRPRSPRSPRLSPRTRGCSAPRTLDWLRGVVVPAHAGVLRASGSRRRCLATLSPRTRGCSAVEVEGADDDAVFSGALRRIHLAAGK